MPVWYLNKGYTLSTLYFRTKGGIKLLVLAQLENVSTSASIQLAALAKTIVSQDIPIKD